METACLMNLSSEKDYNSADENFNLLNLQNARR